MFGRTGGQTLEKNYESIKKDLSTTRESQKIKLKYRSVFITKPIVSKSSFLIEQQRNGFLFDGNVILKTTKVSTQKYSLSRKIGSDG